VDSSFAAEGAFVRAERMLDRAFGARANPLRHLGALGFLLFWVLAASGILLYIRFDTSVPGAYESIGHLEWWFGGIARSVHRYSADAFVIVVALHLARELCAGRFRGFRAFSWISGVPALVLLYASGILGYWLVWDLRSQFSALATAEWFDALPLVGGSIARNFLAAEAVVDRLFSLFVFLHLGLPLALLAAMWVHVQRLGEPRTGVPSSLAAGLLAALVVLALALPATSLARWDSQAAAGALEIDWFLLFLHPLMQATSPQALWGLAAGVTALLVALPWFARQARPVAARVDPANCNGCGRCIADCPYQAVILGAGGKALVMAERCAACGICAGACPSSTPFRSVRELVSGIDLPDATVHDLRRRLDALLASGRSEVRFRCAGGEPRAGAIELRCIAMLPPSFVEYALRRGATRVVATACREGECAWRLGDAIAAGRFAGSREPHLRATVSARKERHEYSFALR
jgi:quinol-cytochrome oxidoreductase complex cytochrome b subunit/coenzyme F420-reducing hydrogenase delta subunit